MKIYNFSLTGDIDRVVFVSTRESKQARHLVQAVCVNACFTGTIEGNMPFKDRLYKRTSCQNVGPCGGEMTIATIFGSMQVYCTKKNLTDWRA